MDTLPIALALLWMGGNVLICVHADKARMRAHTAAFYAVWFTGVAVLPNGGAQWFWWSVWLAVALRSGRLLVLMQEETERVVGR